MTDDRETQLVDTFLAVTDALVAGSDALDTLTVLAERTVEVLDVSAAGVVLADGARGRLSVAAASTEAARLLEVFALAIDDGPCVDCMRTGAPVVVDDVDMAEARDRWPRFTAAAAGAGFLGVHALPMSCRGEVIGVLVLLHTGAHAVTGAEARLARALADAATVGLLHERAVRDADAVAQQIQGALNGRVIIEQAKGVLAAQHDVGPGDAYGILRAHARRTGRGLTALARDVVDRTVELTAAAGAPSDTASRTG